MGPHSPATAPTHRTAQLGRIADLRIGRTPSRARGSYWSDGSIPWVSIGDMSNGHLRRTKELVSSEALADCFGSGLVPAGTLLLSFKLTIGKVAILDIPAVHNEAIVSLRLDENEVDRDYLFYYLQFADLAPDQDTYIKGKTLNRAKLERIPIPLPPLHEQRHIAHVLSTVQRSRTASQTIIGTTAQLEASIRAAVTAGRTEWMELQLEDIATVNTGATPPTDNPEYWGGAIPFVRTNAIDGTAISRGTDFVTQRAVDERRTRVFSPGTIFVAMYGQGKTRGNIGFLTTEAATSQNTAAITCDEAQIRPMFLFHFLRGQYAELRHDGVQGHISHLNAGFVKQFRVMCPPLWEQDRMIQIFDALDKKVLSERTYARRLSDLFQSVLMRFMDTA